VKVKMKEMLRKIRDGVLAAVLMMFVAASISAQPEYAMQRDQPRKEPEKVKEKEKPKRDDNQGGSSRGKDDQRRKDEPKRKPFF